MFRILAWGRALGRNGALLGLERSTQTPPRLRRLFRLARLGVRVPPTPAYARAFEALGPAGIKLGQILSTRPELVGEEAARDLERLQDSLPPAPWAEVEPLLEKALGGTWATHFSSFNREAIGAASMAQVYRATTHDGHDVAVKVLRPRVAQVFARDIALFEWIAAKLEARGGEFARLRPTAVIAMFKLWVSRELDLRMEAASASELKEKMAGEAGYHVPRVYWEHTEREVLTLDWVQGIKLNDVAGLEAAGVDRRALAYNLARNFLYQAVVLGYFHADLHPGNVFATPEGGIAVVDFGIMGRLDTKGRLWLAEILYGLITGDYLRVAQIHFDAEYVPAHHNVEDMATALRMVGEPVRGKPVKELNISKLLEGLFATTRAFDMQVQPHLLLLQKSMGMLIGVAYALDPELNLNEIFLPLVREWLRDELGPEAKLAALFHQGLRILKQLPNVLETMMKARGD
jgi:ubiquinone biosynthesis protein